MMLPFGLENKTMTYTDGRAVTYAEHFEALRHLMHSNSWECKTIEQVEKRLQDFAINCGQDLCAMALCGPIPFFGKFLLELRKWTQSVVTGAKCGFDDVSGTFHPNLIFDMGSAVDKQTNCSPMFRLLVSGMNGRRCCGGNTPGPHFVPTTRVVDALNALTFLPTAESRMFLQKYGDLARMSACIEEFNSLVRNNGINISFEKYENPATGANAYNLYEARRVFDSSRRLTTEQLRPFCTMLQSIAEKMDKCSLATRDICAWNLSEYLSRVWCAAQDTCDFSSLLIDEIVLRSLAGAFPGRDVNQDILACKMCQLYFLGEP